MALKTSDFSRGRLSLGLSLCPRLLEVNVAVFVFLFAFGLFLLGCLVFGVCLHCLPAAVVLFCFCFCLAFYFSLYLFMGRAFIIHSILIYCPMLCSSLL